MGMYGGVETDGDTPRLSAESINVSWRRRGLHVALATGLLLLTSFAVAVLVDSPSVTWRSSLDEADADSQQVATYTNAHV
jgi:hypothetical protein